MPDYRKLNNSDQLLRAFVLLRIQPPPSPPPKPAGCVSLPPALLQPQTLPNSSSLALLPNPYHPPMGQCAASIGLSSTPAPLTPEQMKARRKEVIAFRERYAGYAKSLSPPSNCVFAVEVEPWIASPEGTRGVDDALASFQRGSHASTREINMALSGLRSVDNIYDYKKSIVVSLKDSKTKDCISAALMVEHDTGGGTIVELIWFVTQRKQEDKKYGTVLFRCIRDVVRMAGAKALLVTSSTCASERSGRSVRPSSPTFSFCSLARSAPGDWLLAAVPSPPEGEESERAVLLDHHHPPPEPGQGHAEG